MAIQNASSLSGSYFSSSYGLFQTYLKNMGKISWLAYICLFLYFQILVPWNTIVTNIDLILN